MKKFYILTISILVAFQCNAQFDWGSINFDDSTYLNYIFIDTANCPGNIWQVGSPDKIVFDEAYSLPNAIVTDTMQPYATNDTSVFYIRYITPETIPGWWMFSVLHLFYKVDTDKDSDYGKIEFSPDYGELWIDYLTDTIYNNCYNANKPPYFTGSGDEWEYFEIFNDPWCFGINEGDTLWYRFTFITDENQTGKDGWIIDDILLNDFYETIKEFNNKNQTLLVYPNPSKDYVILGYKLETESSGSINISDINGSSVYIVTTTGKQDQVTIVTKDWKPGVYIATLLIDGKSLESVKFTLVK